jgi:hypothetical protein
MVHHKTWRGAIRRAAGAALEAGFGEGFDQFG